MFSRTFLNILCLGTLVTLPAFAADPWPNSIIPNSAGVAAHYNSPAYNPAYNAKTFDSLQQMNAKLVRFVPDWQDIEQKKGVYDFTKADWMTQQFQARGMRVVLCLGLNNPLYGVNARINTQEQRDAFVRFTQAMVEHYRGQQIIWEVWNEPNIPAFWKPATGETLTMQTAVNEYLTLVDAVVPVIRKADPNALIIGPGASNYNTAWLRQALSQGLLDRLDGLSVHPYQGTGRPELVIDQHNQVQGWIPTVNRGKPIFFTEWGYSTGTGSTEVSQTVQANYAQRQYMLSLLLGIRGNFIYSLTDASTASPCVSPDACYGIFTKSDGTAKPIYAALKQVTDQLSGYTFSRRVTGPSPTIYILEFKNETQSKYAFWTSTDNTKVAFTLPNGVAATATNTVQVL